MGNHTGAAKQIQTKNSTFCTQTHCMSHRHNLVSTWPLTDNQIKRAALLNFLTIYSFNYLYNKPAPTNIKRSTKYFRRAGINNKEALLQ